MRRQMTGLTLIEVLIALAIISISLTAIIKAVTQNIRATTYLQSKSIALWIGQEIMNDVQLGVIKLADEREDGVTAVNMLGRDMFWRATEAETGNKHISKIRVRVYEREPKDEESSSLIDLDGYRYHAN